MKFLMLMSLALSLTTGARAQESTCTTYEGRGVCIGDRLLVEVQTIDYRQYYIEVVGFKEYWHGGHEIRGRLVGHPQGKIIKDQNFRLLDRSGPVPGFSGFEFSVEFQNPRGYSDTILSDNDISGNRQIEDPNFKRNYFVYLGEEGIARGFSEDELRAHIGLDPRPSTSPANRCPDFRGDYEFKSCEKKGHDVWYPLPQQNSSIRVDQSGCDSLIITTLNKEHSSSFYPDNGAHVFDLKEAKFTSDSARVKDRDWKAGAGSPIGIIIPYVARRSRTTSWEKTDSSLILKVSSLDLGLVLIVPQLDRRSSTCEFVKSN